MRHEVPLSTSSGRRSIIIDDAFCQSLRVPVGDNSAVVGLFVASWVTLLADSPLNPERKPYRTYTKFLNRIREDGVKAVVLRFADLAHELVSRHTLMGSGSSIGDWIDGFKDTPVFFEYNRYFKTGDVALLRYLYTFLNFGKKLDYVDESFNDTAFRGWCDVEKRLDGLTVPEEDAAALRKILGTLLPPLVLDDFRPKFGPGSVAERSVHGRIGKLNNFKFDPLIDRFFFHGHLGKYGYGEDDGLTPEKIIPDPSMWTPAKGVSSRIARLQFVPKNLKVSRSICMEPNTLMFFQQAVMRQFLEHMSRSEFSRFVNISDQSRNQRLAREGSISSEIDTLDLTSASDSLSLQLVRLVFPPTWRIAMEVTRSHRVRLPNGDVIPVKKFAPMGSALCFPTQCLIFASVCIYAACKYVYEAESYTESFLDWLTDERVRDVCASFKEHLPYGSAGFQPLAVYGDDICVDRRLTDIVKLILSRLGFQVNHQKSFTGSQSFRESCGSFYLDGNDITPLYFRVKGVAEKLSPSHVVSQVHLINECRARDLKHLYRFLHRTIMAWGCHGYLRNRYHDKNPIPYVSDPTMFGIYVPEPHNTHVQARVHPDYQRDEIRCWTISYEWRVEPGRLLSAVDAYEHMRWWASRRNPDSIADQKSVSRCDTGGPGLRWRWIPAQ